MSNLLILEPPLMVLPTLATKIGLNEAIILQQIHYWLDPRGNKNLKEGRHWVYNSYKEWKKQFPFWAERTLQRAILSLEKLNLLIVSNFSKNPLDKTKWYTINYAELSNISKDFTRTCQNGIIEDVNLAPPTCQNGTIYNKDTETTTEITNSSLNPSLTSVDSKKRRSKSLFDKKEALSTFLPSELALSMIQCWNELVGQGPISLTLKMAELLENALEKEFQGSIDQWKDYCLKISSSKYLMGETDHKFKPTLGWCLNKETIEKIRGGFYTTNTRKVIALKKQGSSEDFDTRELIEESEMNLIEKIRGGEGDIPFRDVFTRRVKLGLEGLDKKELLSSSGWYRGGFQRLLDDYIDDMTSFAPQYSKETSIDSETIFQEEEALIEKIRGEEGDIPFRDVFIRRIQVGLEGISKQGKLQLNRWYRGEFEGLLEDYTAHMLYQAQNLSNDNIESIEIQERSA